MMMLLSEADSNFISHGQSIFATNINLMMLGSKGILTLTDAQDCFIATQFSQSCKHLPSRIFASKSALCRCLAGQASR